MDNAFMQHYQLSFGTFYDHGNGIIEGVVDAGVEITVTHLKELVALLQSITPAPKGLLANRINQYSFSFNAMLFIAQQKELTAVAELIHGRMATYIPDILWPKFFKIAFFKDRDRALDWLIQTIDKNS